MEKKIPVKNVAKLNDNDKRTLLDYSNYILLATSQMSSEAAIQKDMLKLT